jgi:NAD(P)-dependent dehydrogenase (short-subunit alcohol dehydrogenase family)
VCDRDPDAVASAVESLEAQGGETLGVVGDVSDRTAVQANVGQVMERTQALAPADVLSEDHWRRELDVCLTGSFLWAQAVAVASMIPRRAGSIVNMGSGGALVALPHSASYVAAKHGVIGLTKALAIDWGRYGIRVNCVCPGFTWTDLARSVGAANPDAMRQRIERIPYGQGAQPADIARAIAFLASEDGGAASGSTVTVDGGTVALSSGYSAPTGD